MAGIKKFTVTEPFLKLQCGLGEAPYWEEATNTLRFVDIVKQKVHVVDLKEGPSSHKILADLDISIGVTADLEGSDEQVAFGGKHGYGLLNRKTGQYEYIKKFWDDKEISQGKEKRMRANDGAVDSKGRFWVGTMNDPLVVDEPGPEGTLFRLDPDGKLHRVLEGVTIPNGMSWTKDEKTMYITDSPTKTISAFDYDKETGGISNRRPFFKVEEEDGVPDGHAVDSEGFLWVCCFGLGRVRRVSPEGKVVAEIELPTRCCSCPVIAGEDLFITSAEEEAPKNFPESVKYGGSLFKCHIGVTGKKPLRFRWNGSSA